MGYLLFFASHSVLIMDVLDEVESLTAARASAMKGNEPSDSLRVGLTAESNNLHTHAWPIRS